MIANRLVIEGGWIVRKGVTCFNLYQPPTIKLGDGGDVNPWLKHIRRTLSGRRQSYHFLAGASRAAPRREDQSRAGDRWRPGHRQGHDAGAGQEGRWRLEFLRTFSLADPMGRFNPFLKSVILRINEARDLGEYDRFKFYDHLKALYSSTARCDAVR